MRSEALRGIPSTRKASKLEARVAGEPLLDRVRPSGERDEAAAPAERFGYRERGQDVTGCSSGGDQEPRLLDSAAWLTAMLRRMPTDARPTMRLDPP